MEKEKNHMTKIQNGIKLLSLGRATWKRRREVLASKKSFQLIKVDIPRVSNLYFDMKQIVVVPASQYN